MLLHKHVIFRTLRLSSKAHLRSWSNTLVVFWFSFFSSFTVSVKVETKTRLATVPQFLDEDVIKMYLIL